MNEGMTAKGLTIDMMAAKERRMECMVRSACA
jgi:hypothetical protein